MDITQSTTPVLIDDSIYQIKKVLGWYDKDGISDFSEIVPAKGELKKQLKALKERNGLVYKKFLTEQDEQETPKRFFSDADLVDFKDRRGYTLAKVRAYIAKWVMIEEIEGQEPKEKTINLTDENLKLIPPPHFELIIKKINEVEQISKPFRGEPETKG